MINSKKKGFTIVELVIVVAVIAVLAAVLIPTFSNLVKKANMSADQMAVKQMNTALSVVSVEDNPDEFRELIDILDGNGYNVKSLTPLSKGYIFVWNKAENKIEMVEETTSTDNVTTFNLATGASYIDVEVKSSKDLIQALSAGSDVTLTADVKGVNSEILVTGDVTINMNGFDFDASSVRGARAFALADGATLTINAQGSEIFCGDYGLVNVPAGNNGTIIINGGTYITDDDCSLAAGSMIRVRESSTKVDITLNDVYYKDSADKGYIINTYGIVAEECQGTITVNGGTFEANSGFQTYGNLVMNNATVTTNALAFEIMGTATITNSTITVGNGIDGAPASAVAVSCGGSATVTGCKINCNDTPSVYAVYSGNGSVNYSNNTVSGTYTKEYIIYENE